MPLKRPLTRIKSRKPGTRQNRAMWYSMAVPHPYLASAAFLAWHGWAF